MTVSGQDTISNTTKSPGCSQLQVLIMKLVFIPSHILGSFAGLGPKITNYFSMQTIFLLHVPHDRVHCLSAPISIAPEVAFGTGPITADVWRWEA